MYLILWCDDLLLMSDLWINHWRQWNSFLSVWIVKRWHHGGVQYIPLTEKMWKTLRDPYSILYYSPRGMFFILYFAHVFGDSTLNHTSLKHYYIIFLKTYKYMIAFYYSIFFEIASQRPPTNPNYASAWGILTTFQRHWLCVLFIKVPKG